jgi:hypothetical protein
VSLKLQWTVLRSALPARWKPLAMLLALIAKDDGTGIWVRAETAAGYLGLHRVTVSRLLQELHDSGIVTAVRRGGRWRTKREGNVVGRATERCLNRTAIEQFGCSHAATRSADLVVTQLHGPPDLVATQLRIKTGTYGKTGTPGGKTDRKSTAPPAAPPSDSVTGLRRLQAWREKKEQL